MTITKGMKAESPSQQASAPARYELCFHDLSDKACVFRFPCDAAGRVDLDSLTERARQDYHFARMVIGRVFRSPDVRLSH